MTIGMLLAQTSESAAPSGTGLPEPLITGVVVLVGWAFVQGIKYGRGKLQERKNNKHGNPHKSPSGTEIRCPFADDIAHSILTDIKTQATLSAESSNRIERMCGRIIDRLPSR